MKKFSKILVLLLVLPLLSGCFGVGIKRAVESYQTGIIMSDGVSISNVVGSGRYSDYSLHAQLIVIDNTVHQVRWEGDDLWTKDKQPLDFVIIADYHRTNNEEEIRRLWGTYKTVFTDDYIMEQRVLSRIPESAKEMTVGKTLEGMLGISEEGGRNKAQEVLFAELSKELAEFGIVLDNVTIDTITASDEYIQKLQEKANATLQVELARQLTLQLQEQLAQEEAQTNINLEIARRENLVAEEKAKVYQESPEALELRRLELLGNALGDTTKFFFIQPGTDLSLLLNANGSVIPFGN